MKNFKLITVLAMLSPLSVVSKENVKKESTQVSVPTQKAYIMIEDAFNKGTQTARVKSIIESEGRKLQDLQQHLQTKYQSIISNEKTTKGEKQAALEALQKEYTEKVEKVQSLQTKLTNLISEYNKKFLKTNIVKYQEIIIVSSNDSHVYNSAYLEKEFVNLTSEYLAGLERELKKFGVK